LEKDQDYIDDLLGKYLAGEASDDERSQVNQWINEADENQRYFNQFREIFDAAANISHWKGYDTDAAWSRVRENLHRKNGKVVTIGKPRPAVEWWKLAAAALIFIFAGVYLYQATNTESSPVVVIAKAKAVNDTLPDGSNVFLNKQSKLEYAYDRSKKRHDVQLVGEAYFDVNHAKGEQFIIQAGEVFIRDIGTSFNVKAYPGSDLVEVLVEEGEIVFYTAENPGIHLKESGQGVYNRKTKQFTIDQPDPNITAYKTKFFVFSETRLGEVVNALNNVYETPIVIADHLRECPITVSFRDESIDEIAAILAETLSLEIARKDGKIELTGKGCE
jgi:transmembrane sensor